MWKKHGRDSARLFDSPHIAGVTGFPYGRIVVTYAWAKLLSNSTEQVVAAPPVVVQGNVAFLNERAMKPVTGNPTNVWGAGPVTTPADVIVKLVPARLLRPSGVCDFDPRNAIRAQPFWNVLGRVIATLLIEPSTPVTDPDAVLVELPLRMLTTVVSKHSVGVAPVGGTGEIHDGAAEGASSLFQKLNRTGSHAPLVVTMVENGW